ncbi:restriction endonuclease subunit S [Proteus mirabilis]|uniref:restriction endonuclease subunit S n=1 Tax=Proteus TaxID=583 RepID=UPI000538DE2B|nr:MULTISPECIES: restriction endonuclease subunit S [Proteus]AUU13461.1 restriction endonuclease subunit S [Proteus mirabilis]MBG2897007.1 restriction endonuclease subunit S [Proteus mirabilis]MBG2966383.1 restriction endonuclease subunit S [Proteus mirabilis]MBG2984254.1 restriction endonuclease subunit S [Proteus mirabilis]MBG3138893.1 restriction endonuclease subunit S [Proteus mirabilis]
MGSKWQQIPLGQLISLQRGHDLPTQNRVNGQIPVMGSSGLTGWHNVSKCTGPGVVIGRSGNSMGVVSYSDSDFWPLNTCLYVTDFKGNDEKYIYYMLQQIDFDKFNSGSAQKSLNRNAVYPYNVMATIDIEEQKSIGKILANFEDKITLNRQINQTLEQMAQTLFKSWFVDFDPVVDNALDAGFFEQDLGFSDELLHRVEIRKAVRESGNFKPLSEDIRRLFPDSFEECAESALGLGGWVPKRWQISTVDDELTVKGGSTPSTANPEFWERGNIHWTSPKDLSGSQEKIMLDTERKITELGLRKITSGLLPINTVLMSSRAPIGYLAMAKIPVAINQGYIAITTTKRLSQEYVLYWLDSSMDEIKGIAGGTTFAEISKKTFKSISMIIPDSQVIEKYTVIIKSYLNKATLNAKERGGLEKLRDTLLPKLISGELSLSDIKIDIPEETLI